MFIKLKKGIPHLLTSANLFCGVIAIIISFKGYLSYAPFFIFAAAVFDFFDGFAARILKVSGDFGKQLDSLADVVTFGVAPGIIVFQFFQISTISSEFIGEKEINTIDDLLLIQGNTELLYMSFAALMIPVFSAIRLAKFNIDTRQSDQFIGLPTPANALFFASFPLIFNEALHSDNSWKMIFADILSNDTVLLNLTLIFSLLLIAEIPLFSLKFKSFGIKENLLKYTFLLVSIILLSSLFFWALPLIIILYVILSIIKYII